MQTLPELDVNVMHEKNLISKNESEIAKLYPYHIFNFSDNIQYGIPIIIRIGSATFFP